MTRQAPTSPHPLDILFLTNFSDYCFRSIPSIAQMADGFSVRLTLLHAFDPSRTTAVQAQDTLASFYPEADRYRSCRRVAIPLPLIDAVKQHLETWPANLIVAPASDPMGLPRIGDRSLRARLIEQCGIPVWTMGRRALPGKLSQAVKNVACWLDFHGHGFPHLPFAIEYAHRLGANLHVLHPVPHIHEGSLMPAAHQDTALHPQQASEEIARLCAAAPIRPNIHVMHDEGRRALRRMLINCDADLVFLRNDEWFVTRWFGLGLRLGDAIPCPAIYVGDRIDMPLWNLEPGSANRLKAAFRPGNGVRSRTAAAGSRGEIASGLSLPGIAELGL